MGVARTYETRVADDETGLSARIVAVPVGSISDPLLGGSQASPCPSLLSSRKRLVHPLPGSFYGDMVSGHPREDAAHLTCPQCKMRHATPSKGSPSSLVPFLWWAYGHHHNAPCATLRIAFSLPFSSPMCRAFRQGRSPVFQRGGSRNIPKRDFGVFFDGICASRSLFSVLGTRFEYFLLFCTGLFRVYKKMTDLALSVLHMSGRLVRAWDGNAGWGFGRCRGIRAADWITI